MKEEDASCSKTMKEETAALRTKKHILFDSQFNKVTPVYSM